MQAMAEREEHHVLAGNVQVDDAYLGGERSGGKVGRGSENKIPFVAAVSLTDQGHPLPIKLTPVPGFTLKAVALWAKAHLAPYSAVFSEGLACFSAVTEAGCRHHPTVMAGRKPKDVPEFQWINSSSATSRPVSPVATIRLTFDTMRLVTSPLSPTVLTVASIWQHSMSVC